MNSQKSQKKIPGIIILTGFMGSGKSTLGKELAGKINRSHVDIDSMIENETGMSISDIFYKYGEEYFRQIENKIFEKILNQAEGEIVISSGGGTLTFENNWKLIENRDVLTVFLDEQFETLWERIKNDPKRPLAALNQLDENEVRQRLLALLQKREPWYNRADIILHQPSSLTLDEIVEKILTNSTPKEKHLK